MSSERSSPDAMVQWYRDRIAEPTTSDEVYGYWVFVFGILLGILGILLFLTSDVTTATTPGKAGIALAAISLVLLMIGPVIRLPLQRTANLISYAGGAVALLGVVGFLVAYPGWRASGLAVPVISLFAFGLVLIAVGAALIPVIGGSRRAPEADASVAEPTESDPAVETAEDPKGAAATAEEPDAEPVAEPPESKARFEVFADRGGKWRWRLRHRNGNIIADSAQGYSSRQKAEQGLESVRTNAPGAAAVREEIEVEPEEEPADAPYPPGESQGTFEVYEDAAGEYRWRLVHRNGNIVADGGEGYDDRDAVDDAVERVREYVGPADYLRIDPTAFEVYRDAADEWRWRLIHRNGEILADGGQGFASERGARDSVGRVREYADEAGALDYRDAAFEVFEDNAGEYRWRLRHQNGQILGDSGEGYASRTGAIDGLRSVKRNAPNAELDDLDAGDDADTADGDADGDEE
ncbi:HVO_2922 family protein [Halosimplex rubrum]|nr:HVO_2922 family protein [Halosimplex rubrum]